MVFLFNCLVVNLSLLLLYPYSFKLHIDRTAIENYKFVKRYPVFSHDELVCRLASSSNLSLDMVQIIEQELYAIIQFEKKYRSKLKEQVLAF